MGDEEHRELEYYRRQLDEVAAENHQLQVKMAELTTALTQKRQGFAVLSELQQTVGAHQEISSIFDIALKAIRGMNKAVVLTPTTDEGHFRPTQWMGFHQEADGRLPALQFEFPAEIASGEGFLLVTQSTESTDLIDQIRAAFDLAGFLCVPVMGESAPIGLLLAGRKIEARPLSPPLDQGDVDTFVAIAGLISASVRNLRLAVVEEMDRLKTEFFANISHEFRTPLALTLGPLEQIMLGRAGDVPDKVLELAEVMHRNQRRLLGLINQILDLTKFEAGEMQLRAAPLPDVDGFVAERVEQFRLPTAQDLRPLPPGGRRGGPGVRGQRYRPRPREGDHQAPRRLGQRSERARQGKPLHRHHPAGKGASQSGHGRGHGLRGSGGPRSSRAGGR